MPIPATPQPSARTLARDQAYASIRQAILEGSLLPGERLDDGELQQWLGISSTPVRQALYALTLEGLVETAPQSYTRVVAPRPEDAIEHLQALGIIALGHMELTLPTLSDAELRRLAAGLQVIKDDLEAHDLRGAIKASETYYLDLVGLCRNRQLKRITEQTAFAMAYYVTAVADQLSFDMDLTARQYGFLMDAIRERRFADAAIAVRPLFGLVPLDEPPLLA